MDVDIKTTQQSLKLPSTIEDLPDEVLEFILGTLPPYKDLQNCKTVSKRWYNCAENVLRKTSMKLVKAIGEFNIAWKKIASTELSPTITRRFSHAACVLDNNMYVFGGCTTNATSFNDLWKFDLSNREWVRPLATGTYPVPKAYTTMVSYKDCLIVFGGWTYPSHSQFYQNVTMFNDIHSYSVGNNKWILIKTTNSPPPMAGHSACIRENEMVVFGGLVMSTAMNYNIRCSNDVWVLDLSTMNWRLQATTKPRPPPRYAQSLVPLNSDQVMVLGGVQTLQNRFVYSDCWVLTMKGPTWTWKELAVRNKEWASANIWCNPACKVGDKIVSLSRTRLAWNCAKPLVTSAVRLSALNRPEGAPVSVRVEQSLLRPLDRDLNINGRRGVLPRQASNSARQQQINSDNEPIAGPSNYQGASNDQGSSNDQGASNDEGASSDQGASNDEGAGNDEGGSNDQGASNDQGDSNDQGTSSDEGVSNDQGASNDQGGIPTVNATNKNASLEGNSPAAGPSSDSNKSGSALDLGKKQSIMRRNLNKNKNKGVKIVRQLQEANKYRMAAFACDNNVNAAPPENDLINQRQIAHLENRLEEEPQVDIPVQQQPAVKKIKRNTLTMHVLDISSILNGNMMNYVAWLCPRLGEATGAPEELVMYSLVQGNGELIMFGGVHNDISISNYSPHQSMYSNSLHLITPPRDII